ncbi:MAG: nuclear transport factor 2 family protein [Burkholderiaceae bacterium]
MSAGFSDARRVLLRDYFHAKDENRPHLLAQVFTESARLTIANRSANIAFPAQITGREAIAATCWCAISGGPTRTSTRSTLANPTRTRRVAATGWW